MNKARFYQYLSHPELLDDRSIGEIEAVLKEYPYFQSSRLLYLKNLSNQGNIIYEKELKRTAVWVTDRASLFYLLDQRVLLPINDAIKENKVPANFIETNLNEVIDFSELSSVTSFEQETSTAGKLRTMDDELAQLIMSGAAQSANLFNVNDDVDMDAFLNTFGKKGSKQHQIESQKPSDTHRQKLIDTFIQDQPRILPKPMTDSEPVKSIEFEPHEDMEMITDTLAKIYVKQGKYEKAITAYEKLSLKYPEKNIYFASQIQKIKQTINNL